MPAKKKIVTFRRTGKGKKSDGQRKSIECLTYVTF